MWAHYLVSVKYLVDEKCNWQQRPNCLLIYSTQLLLKWVEAGPGKPRGRFGCRCKVPWLICLCRASQGSSSGKLSGLCWHRSPMLILFCCCLFFKLAIEDSCWSQWALAWVGWVVCRWRQLPRFCGAAGITLGQAMQKWLGATCI